MTTIKECGLLYRGHKNNAKTRGIPWEFEFYEWLHVWTESGKFSQRGRRKGQYVMARFGDVGPYSANNVKIILCSENIREAVHDRCLGDLPNGKEIMAQLNASFKKSVADYLERAMNYTPRRVAHLAPTPEITHA